MAWNAPSEVRTSRSRGNSISLLDASYLDDFTVYDSARISVDSRASDYLATLGCSNMSHVSAVSADFGRMFLDASDRTADSFEVRSLLKEKNGSVLKEWNGSIASRGDEAMSMSSCNEASVGGRRRRGRQRTPIKKRTPRMLKDVNFDPAPADNPKPKCQGRVRRDDRYENPCPWHCEDASDADAVQSLVSLSKDCQDASDADAVQSLMSLSRGGSREEPHVAADPGAGGQNGNGVRGADAGGRRQVSYEEALQSLADSMRRTERSRRQVMMQRAVLGAKAPPFFAVSGGAPVVYSDPLSRDNFPYDAMMGGERQGFASAHCLGREQ